MARTLGTYSLSANIEMLAGAPLDAREIVPAKADLTTSGMFPYAYIGMETYVVAENKKYRLIGIDPTVPTNWEEATGGSDVVQGYYVDGHFYKYPVVEGSYGEDGTTDFYTLVDYGYMTMWEPVSNPQLNTIYYDSKHTPHKAYMWTGSAYTDQVSGEITGDTRDWYVDLTTKTTYYYNGSAFVMTVDGTLMDKKTYSMSNHYITSLSDGKKFGFIDYIENLESALVTAISDHATWVSGLVTIPAADHTYDIIDHEVIDTQMTPASHTVTEWVSNLNTAFVNAISDHASWISGLTLTNVTVTNTNPTSSTDYYPVWHTSTSGTSGLKANNGLKYNTIEGTASAVGKGQLQLGNSTSSGTAGNKTGSILLFSEKNGYAIIKPTASSTNERIFTLPDKAGTVALTSDITDTKVTVTNTNPSSGTTYYPVWYTATSGTDGVGANDGLSYETLQGTTSAAGYGCLNIGNTTSTGTAGNKYGVLRLYGQKNAFATLRATQTSTTNRTIILPDKDGTIALTSDLSDTKVTQTASTTNANYEIVFSETADNTTRTEGTKKCANLLFNPSTNVLTIGGSAAAIAYKSTKSTGNIISFIDNTSNADGNGIAIGGGGQTIIGGGESWSVMKAQVGTAGSELMYVGNDGAVNIFSNLQSGWSYRKEFIFGTDGGLTIPGPVKLLYNSSTKSLDFIF